MVIGGFRWQDLKWLAYVTVRLQPTVRLQLCRLINAKYRSLCTNHISGNCNGYDYGNYYWQLFTKKHQLRMSKVSDQNALILGTSPSSFDHSTVRKSISSLSPVLIGRKTNFLYFVWKISHVQWTIHDVQTIKCQMCLRYAYVGSIYSKSLKGSQLAVITLSFENCCLERKQIMSNKIHFSKGNHLIFVCLNITFYILKRKILKNNSGP